ncbi:MAG TPA: hypothetical protein VJ862_08045 [Rhodanobacteraceae bacterium]|nr:hypothetical protein [Rhodanobacteraceae bacterium]
MPRIALAAADLPLGQRLLAGLRYPLTGAALAACIALGLCRYANLLTRAAPGLVGVVLGIVVSVALWTATWRYAIDCMVHTADGYSEPPEVSLEDRLGSPHALLVVHALVLLVCVLLALLAHDYLWFALAVVAVLLPVIDMSLAFDGSLAVALNPLTWVLTIGRFGAAYLIPVAANLVLAVLVWMASRGASDLPMLFGLPLYGFACTYLVVLDFHWMGLLIWHYRERFGMHPEAPAMARATHQDADDELVRECEALARNDPEAAAIRLRDRIRERVAPSPIHALFRVLLRKLHRNDLLLQHGRTWIAQLCAAGEARRALGVVQECREIDPAFLPDDPDHTAALARAATRNGMRALSGHLVHGFVERWPRHQAASEIGGLIAKPDSIE